MRMCLDETKILFRFAAGKISTGIIGSEVYACIPENARNFRRYAAII